MAEGVYFELNSIIDNPLRRVVRDITRLDSSWGDIEVPKKKEDLIDALLAYMARKSTAELAPLLEHTQSQTSKRLAHWARPVLQHYSDPHIAHIYLGSDLLPTPFVQAYAMGLGNIGVKVFNALGRRPRIVNGIYTGRLFDSEPAVSYIDVRDTLRLAVSGSARAVDLLQRAHQTDGYTLLVDPSQRLLNRYLQDETIADPWPTILTTTPKSTVVTLDMVLEDGYQVEPIFDLSNPDERQAFVHELKEDGAL